HHQRGGGLASRRGCSVARRRYGDVLSCCCCCCDRPCGSGLVSPGNSCVCGIQPFLFCAQRCYRQVLRRQHAGAAGPTGLALPWSRSDRHGRQPPHGPPGDVRSRRRLLRKRVQLRGLRG
ncbi:unnamed protein product, partial [Ectocarpus sp. 6 AP-2014]